MTGTATILRADARHLPLADGSVDAIVCDPPYALPGGFMGKTWDRFDEPRAFQAWCEVWAGEALRVLKPGGYLLAFGGSRTWHRLTCAIEDAGFEIRDSMAWHYGSGFPKSLNVSEAVDQHRAARGSDAVDQIRAWLNARRVEAGLSLTQVNDALGAASNGGGLASAWMTNPTSKGMPDWQQWCQLKALLGFGEEMDAEVRRLHEVRDGLDRPVIGQGYRIRRESTVQFTGLSGGAYDLRAAASEPARLWAGWGTALKPGFEPIVVARKPLAGTVAANVLQFGTGALNIEGCRIPTSAEDATAMQRANSPGSARMKAGASPIGTFGRANGSGALDTTQGRWPTNVVLSHAPKLDEQGEIVGDACADGCVAGCPVADLDGQSGTLTSGSRRAGTHGLMGYMGAGPAEMPAVTGDSGGASRFFPTFRYEAKAPSSERPRVNGIAHNTVKPLGLIRWLCRLVTPSGGRVLDMFGGSGTTAEAALLEGFNVIVGEKDADYLPLIQYRVDRARRRLQPGVARLGKAKPPAKADGQGDLFADLLGGDAA